jgi:hypothetical protein
MQKISFIIILVCLSVVLFAQAPQQFNYQGVARNTEGKAIASKLLKLQLSIIDATEEGKVLYTETQEVTTNQFGLYSLKIGDGTPVYGEFATIKWSFKSKFIKVELDANDGNGLVELGTTQLLSVPYALYAETSGKTLYSEPTVKQTRAGTLNYLSKFNATGSSSAEVNSQVFDDGTNIGLGTASPLSKLHIKNSTTTATTLRIQHTHPSIGFASIAMFADSNNTFAPTTNFAAFNKYPNNATGSAASNIAYSNLSAFYNSQGDLLFGTNGNFAIGYYNGSSVATRLLFHKPTNKIGIGGTALPQSDLHLNNTISGDTMRITNGTTGHTMADGLSLGNNGNAAFLINRENANLSIGTNNTDALTILPNGNVGVGVTNPSAKLDIAGQVKITGGTPGAGKVLTSDAAGLATWQTPTGGSGGGQWTTSGANIYNNNAGAIGIGTGTTAPKAKLEITSAQDTTVLISSTSTISSNGVLIVNNKGITATDNAAIVGINLPDSNNYYGVGVRGIGAYVGGEFKGTNNLLADPYGFNASYGAIISGESDNNETYGSFNFAGQPFNSSTIVGNKTGSVNFAQGGIVNTGINTSAITSDASQTAYGIYSSVSGDGRNVAGYFESDKSDSLNGVVKIINNNTDTSFSQKDLAALVVSNNASSDSVVRGVGLRATGGYLGIESRSFASWSSAFEANSAFLGYTSGRRAWGVRSVAFSSPNTPLFAFGDRYGVQGIAYGGNNNIGIYGEIASGAQNPNTWGSSFAGYFQGAVHVNATFSKAAGTFKIDHPQDPANKYLIHSFVESPDMMNIYNGIVKTDVNGDAIVEMPSYFEILNMDFRYQLTIMDQDNFAMARIVDTIKDNKFRLKTSLPNINVSWQVTGVRHDPYANANRIVAEVQKTGSEKGTYLAPELYNQPASKRFLYNVSIDANMEEIVKQEKLKEGENKAKKPITPQTTLQNLNIKAKR